MIEIWKSVSYNFKHLVCKSKFVELQEGLSRLSKNTHTDINRYKALHIEPSALESMAVIPEGMTRLRYCVSDLQNHEQR